ncbi:hypothetical protein CEXT_563281 [Caerostris extrusa]|uniref:Uncharacterized protein n=1 Tax=Caerostris extrusa TaxID=172846 RepID=A0AAV4WU95_CAEEX|nr:hypothetical protein CEXT_563281 [Caerostris extrusa]
MPSHFDVKHLVLRILYECMSDIKSFPLKSLGFRLLGRKVIKTFREAHLKLFRNFPSTSTLYPAATFSISANAKWDFIANLDAPKAPVPFEEHIIFNPPPRSLKRKKKRPVHVSIRFVCVSLPCQEPAIDSASGFVLAPETCSRSDGQDKDNSGIVVPVRSLTKRSPLFLRF